MEDKITELKEFIHNLWVRSQYSFDEQTAQKELITIIEGIPIMHKIVTLKDLLNYVTDYFQQKTYNVSSYSKRREFVRVRQIYSYMARQLFPGISLSTIGEEIRYDYDHSTVLHGVRTVENELNTDRFLRKSIDKLFSGVNMNINNETEKKMQDS